MTHPRAGGPRLVAFLGGTIGNLDPAERRRFLATWPHAMTADDRLLLGTDLVKDADRLVAAYDDAAGVTAEFNRNVLAVLNARARRRLRPRRVRPRGRVGRDRESHARCACGPDRAQVVRIPGARPRASTFEAGEELHTEISSKFRAEQVAAELDVSGFLVEDTWTDPDGDFLLTLARPYCLRPVLIPTG